MLKALLIGATHIDIFADTHMRFGDTTGKDLPCDFVTSIGGTAFNVCVKLKNLGVDCFLVNAAKKGSLFTFLVKRELSKIMKSRYYMLTKHNIKESAFLAIREKGDLFIAATASAWDEITIEDIKKAIPYFINEKFDFMVIDCNVPSEVQQYLLGENLSPAVYICTTSPVKALRFFAIDKILTKKVRAVFMNEAEFNIVLSFFNTPKDTNFWWFVTQGERGVTVFYKDKKYYFPVKKIRKAKSFSGVGDAFAAGVIYALESGMDLSEAVQFGYKNVIEKVNYLHSNIAPINLEKTTEIFEKDALTGCFSRNMFEEEKLYLSGFSHVMLIDIDYFKKINDTYGHDFGDMVLKEVASTIKSSIRPSDKLYRYGGEEFLLMVSNTSTKNALKIAERIRTKIQKKGVTVSIGVSEVNLSLDKSIKQADTALYQAKNSGRNRVVIANSCELDSSPFAEKVL